MTPLRRVRLTWISIALGFNCLVIAQGFFPLGMFGLSDHPAAGGLLICAMALFGAGAFFRCLPAGSNDIAGPVAWIVAPFAAIIFSFVAMATVGQAVWMFAIGLHMLEHAVPLARPAGFTLVAILANAGVFLWLRRVDREQRAVAGHCIACGYALEASQPMCPECGAAHARYSKGQVHRSKRDQPRGNPRTTE